MKVKGIIFSDDEQPEKIAVEMSLMEAAMIAKVFGGMTDAELEERGFIVDNDIYSALTGMVFNRYYDNGVDEVIPQG